MSGISKEYKSLGTSLASGMGRGCFVDMHLHLRLARHGSLCLNIVVYSVPCKTFAQTRIDAGVRGVANVAYTGA